MPAPPSTSATPGRATQRDKRAARRKKEIETRRRRWFEDGRRRAHRVGGGPALRGGFAAQRLQPQILGSLPWSQAFLTSKAAQLLAERALKYLPGSYKLWRPYLNDRVAQVKNRRPDDPAVEHVNRAYERALVYMHKMPRLWEDYLQFLMRQHKIGPTRHAFDRALRALPITQHERIWTLYVDFAKKCPVKETAVRIYRRYLQFEPDGVEDYIEYLLSIDRVSEAALKLAELLNKENAISTKGKSRHKLWMELCEMCVKNPQAVKQLRVEAIIRSGLRTFPTRWGTCGARSPTFSSGRRASSRPETSTRRPSPPSSR